MANESKASKVSYEEKREQREASQEKREAAQEKREQERHDKDMEEDPNMEAMQMALMGGLSKLVDTGTKIGDAWLVNYSFSDENSIRAQACDLVRKASESHGDNADALKEAAAALLEIGGWVKPKKDAA